MNRHDHAVAFPNPDHDHRHCVDDAVAVAARHCADRGVQLTPLRRQVLELVWTSHKPIGAYEVLAQLAAKAGRKMAPPTVYRALDFLLEQGLVHRVASLNAFVGCHAPGHARAPGILICEHCGQASELDSAVLDRAIQRVAGDMGFAVSRQTIELVGLCADCAARL